MYICLAVCLAFAIVILAAGAVHITDSPVFALLPGGGYATNLLPLLANASSDEYTKDDIYPSIRMIEAQ